MDLRKQNNFDFLRLAAAIMVLYSHAFPLSGVPLEPLLVFTHGQNSLGGIGVWTFFSISGFLITKSYVERDNIGAFVYARLLRIIPALIPVTLLSIFILGPLVSTLSLSEYYSAKETWMYLRNIFPTDIRFILPGVFEHMPNQGVNGALWTLPNELKCYFIVAIVGLLGLFKRKWIWPIVAIIMLYLSVDWIQENNFSRMMRLAFFSGAVYFLFWDKIPRNGWLALLACVGLLICNEIKLLAIGWAIFGTYLVLYLAYWEKVCLWKLTCFGDISYGVYIYAFPIQQTIVYLNGGKMEPVVNFILALPLTVFLAYLSWHLVERNALKLKRKGRGDWLNSN